MFPDMVTEPLEVLTVQFPVIAAGVPSTELTTTMSEVMPVLLTVAGRDDIVPQLTSKIVRANAVASMILPSFVVRSTITMLSFVVGAVICVSAFTNTSAICYTSKESLSYPKTG